MSQTFVHNPNVFQSMKLDYSAASFGKATADAEWFINLGMQTGIQTVLAQTSTSEEAHVTMEALIKDYLLCMTPRLRGTVNLLKSAEDGEDAVQIPRGG
jgi:hypothetical protein